MLIRESHMVEKRGGEGGKHWERWRENVRHFFVCIAGKHPPLLRFVHRHLTDQFLRFSVFIRKVCLFHFNKEQRGTERAFLYE